MLRALIVVAVWLMTMSAASPVSVTLGLTIEASVTPANTLVVTVSNNAKEGDKAFDAVEVFLGGSEEAPACRMVLPAVTVGPLQKRSVEIADKATLGRCMGWPVAATLSRLRRQLILEEVETTVRGPGIEAGVERSAGRPEAALRTDSRLVRLVARTQAREGRFSEAVMLMELR